MLDISFELNNLIETITCHDFLREALFVVHMIFGVITVILTGILSFMSKDGVEELLEGLHTGFERWHLAVINVVSFILAVASLSLSQMLFV